MVWWLSTKQSLRCIKINEPWIVGHNDLVFQSYQNNGRLIMKGCAQLNSVNGWENFSCSRNWTWSARSVGQGLTHGATGAPIVSEDPLYVVYPLNPLNSIGNKYGKIGGPWIKVKDMGGCMDALQQLLLRYMLSDPVCTRWSQWYPLKLKFRLKDSGKHQSQSSVTCRSRSHNFLIQLLQSYQCSS